MNVWLTSVIGFQIVWDNLCTLDTRVGN